jgi:hypothetical protein
MVLAMDPCVATGNAMRFQPALAANAQTAMHL